MRIAATCALMILLSPAGAGAERDEWFRVGPFLQQPTEDAVEVVWEGRGMRPGEVRLVDSGETFRAEPAVRQRVRLEGLVPGARHRYEVRAGEAIARGEVQAPPPAGASIRFAVFGNTRADERVHRLVAARVHARRPDFVLGTGNMVSDGLSLHEWERFFAIQDALLGDAPLFPAVGRHDLQGRQRTADHFEELFALPGQADGPARHYAFTYGSARVVVLDSTAGDDAFAEQTRWLEEALSAARSDDGTDRIFAVSHHGPYSVGLHGGDERIRDAWAPLFAEYGVDAVFSSHDHVYSRAEAEGVRYFVTGGGGAPLYRRDPGADDESANATRYFESVHHALQVDVAGGQVEVNAFRIDGTPIETVTWGEPEPPGAALAAEVRDFFEPPAARPAPSRPAPAGELGEPVEGGLGRLGFGWLGVGLALAGGGVVIYARRR